MTKGFLAGLGAVLAVSAVGAADATACSRSRDCGRHYAPPVAYQYGPPPGYGYLPPRVVYEGPQPYAAPPSYYAPPPHAAPPAVHYAPEYDGAGYGYRRARRCDREHGYEHGYAPDYVPDYAPRASYRGYQPAGVWVPVR